MLQSRMYFYIEGEPEILGQIKLKMRQEGVPYSAIFSNNFQWIFDEKVAEHDLGKYAAEHDRMKIKFEHARTKDLKDQTEQLKKSVELAKIKAEEITAKAAATDHQQALDAKKAEIDETFAKLEKLMKDLDAGSTDPGSLLEMA